MGVKQQPPTHSLFCFYSDGYNSCEFKDEDDCIFYFTYNYDVNNEVKIIAQRGRGMSVYFRGCINLRPANI